MGEQNVHLMQDETRMREFMRALLDEVNALEQMLPTSLFDRADRRIGAEQEMFLVDHARKPAAHAMDVLNIIDDERFTHELALFNLEANLSPQLLSGRCLSALEEETVLLVDKARVAAQSRGLDIALTGILPTLDRADLTLDNMVPSPRYDALNQAVKRLRGSDFKLAISGVDQLEFTHDNLMLEACNTSFQVHFQVKPEEFARLYNFAQAIAGPVLASSVNSPMLLGRRLWAETRIAVFEHSVDHRSEVQQARGHKPRVHFGDHWIEDSVIEIFKEDIARFRVILTTDVEEDPVALVEQGVAPQLNALRLHSGTVYRWNRACYGVKDNTAHLRIEYRALPSGPTVRDEIAGAAFFFGLLSDMVNKVEDVRDQMRFADAKSNFFAAAREGLRAQQTWLGEHKPASELILQTLAPMARRGLEAMNIDHHDIERYMSTIEARVGAGRTGARWMLDSFSQMDDAETVDQRMRHITSAIVANQDGEPGHTWPLAQPCETQDWRDSFRMVGQFMATDLFTVQPDDLVDFAASLMDWRHVRHVPVEDRNNQLVGLVSHRTLVRTIAGGKRKDGPISIADIMKSDPLTVTPDTPTVEAIRRMREQKVSCLPVVQDRQLVGIITEHDLLAVAARVLEEALGGPEQL